LAHILKEGCTTQLPENIHMSLDLLRREIGMPPAEIVSMLRSMASLGIEYTLRPDSDHSGDEVVSVVGLIE
jgi:hypothetical protein